MPATAIDRNRFRAYALDGAMLYFQPAHGVHVRVQVPATAPQRRRTPRVAMFGIFHDIINHDQAATERAGDQITAAMQRLGHRDPETPRLWISFWRHDAVERASAFAAHVPGDRTVCVGSRVLIEPAADRKRLAVHALRRGGDVQTLDGRIRISAIIWHEDFRSSPAAAGVGDFAHADLGSGQSMSRPSTPGCDGASATAASSPYSPRPTGRIGRRRFSRSRPPRLEMSPPPLPHRPTNSVRGSTRGPRTPTRSAQRCGA